MKSSKKISTSITDINKRKGEPKFGPKTSMFTKSSKFEGNQGGQAKFNPSQFKTQHKG